MIEPIFEIETPEETEWQQQALQAQQEAAEAAETPEEGKQPAWRINSTEAADWAFKQVRKYRDEIEQKQAFAAREKEKIDAWLAKETREAQNSANFFEHQLVMYYQELTAADPKAKLSTPNGKVTARKNPPKWIWHDDKAIDYLLERAPELVEEQISYKFNKTEVKKAFRPVETPEGIQLVNEDGEPVDIATVEAQGPTFSVKLEG